MEDHRRVHRQVRDVVTGRPEVDRQTLLWWVLNEAVNALRKIRARELSRWDLSISESALLTIMAGFDHPPTVSDIWRRTVQEHHSVSGMLQRMVAKGLLRKSRDNHRRSVVRVSLTEEGKRACALSQSRREVNAIISSLPPEEQAHMIAGLTALRDKAIEALGFRRITPFP